MAKDRKQTAHRRAAIATVGAALALSASCTENAWSGGAEMSGGGDPVRGRAAIRQYGCGACHQIRGVDGAEGQVGPPLDGIGGRAFIAGRLSNSADNLVRWITDPRGVDDKTAMPDLGVTDSDARDIAAYLYSL
jgi:cytochrome c2